MTTATQLKVGSVVRGSENFTNQKGVAYPTGISVRPARSGTSFPRYNLVRTFVDTTARPWLCGLALGVDGGGGPQLQGRRWPRPPPPISCKV